MYTLREVQKVFAQALNEHQTSGLAKMIKQGRFAPEELVQVYQNNFEISFTDALAAIFVSLEKIVGSVCFAQLARRYLRDHPSGSGDLHQFGSHLAASLSQTPGLENLPYLSDIASIDWAWHEVFHAEGPTWPEADALQQQLQAMQGDIAFVFNTSFRLLITSHSVFRLWCHCRETQGFEDESNLAFEPGSEYVLLYRQGLDVVVQTLGQKQGRWLQSLGRGKTLLQTCADESAGHDAGLLEFLRFIISTGLVSSVRQAVGAPGTSRIAS